MQHTDGVALGAENGGQVWEPHGPPEGGPHDGVGHAGGEARANWLNRSAPSATEVEESMLPCVDADTWLSPAE